MQTIHICCQINIHILYISLVNNCCLFMTRKVTSLIEKKIVGNFDRTQFLLKTCLNTVESKLIDKNCIIVAFIYQY